MIYAKILWFVIGVMLVFYYLLVAMQCFGLVRFSHEKITFPKVLIPFIYLFK